MNGWRPRVKINNRRTIKEAAVGKRNERFLLAEKLFFIHFALKILNKFLHF